MLIPGVHNSVKLNENITFQSDGIYHLNGRKVALPSDKENLNSEVIDAILSEPEAHKRINTIDDDSLLKEITKRCIAEKKYHLLKSVNCRDSYGDVESMYNKPAFQFLLDKILPENARSRNYFIGGFPAAPAYTLARALEETMLKLKLENTLIDKHPELETIIERCLISLSMCIYFDLNKDTCESEVIDLIRDQNKDFPTLIPVRYHGHSMEILVEPSEPGFCRVTLCNSGGGLHHHPQWPGSKLRQFTLSYDHVPINDLTTQGAWEPMLGSRFPSEQFYDYFRTLMKNGSLCPPSTQRYDYQRGQMQGTCPTRGLMAFFRFYLLREIEGSALEKLGCYHFLKAKMYLSIGKLHKQELHESISQDTEAKMKKFTIELALFEAAKNSERYETAKNLLRTFLREIGESEFVERTDAELGENNSAIERFSTLLMYQQRIGHHFLENVEDIEIFNDFLEQHEDRDDLLELSYFLITEKLETQTRILNIWDSTLFSGDLAELKNDFSKLPAYPGMEVKIAERWLHLHIEENNMSHSFNPRIFEGLQKILNHFETPDKGNNGDPLKVIQ